MSLTRCFKSAFVLLIFATFVPATARQTASATNIVTAKIKLNDLSMIIVPVSINGAGPYDFLLDTGCAKTIVDQTLAAELRLPSVGEKTIVGVLASNRAAVVHVNSLSVAGATVPGGEVFSSGHIATVAGRVRGVLGEDFLRNFDLLIDYRHQDIRFESPFGSMAQTATGEHLPLELSGTLHGKPTHNRLVISGHIPEFGDTPLLLLLDSGANFLTLFQANLGQSSNQQENVQTGNFNTWISSSAATRTIRYLSLGSHSVPNLTVVTFARHADVDTDGLVPASLFKSVFISSRGGFVILNPSFPKSR